MLEVVREALYMFLLLLQGCFNLKQKFVVEIAHIYIYIYNSYLEFQQRQINSIAAEENFAQKLLERREAWQWGWTQSMMQSERKEPLKSVGTEEAPCETTAEDELCLCSLLRLCWGEMQAPLTQGLPQTKHSQKSLLRTELSSKYMGFILSLISLSEV